MEILIGLILIIGFIVRIIFVMTSAAGESLVETKKDFKMVLFIPFYWWVLLFKAVAEELED